MLYGAIVKSRRNFFNTLPGTSGAVRLPVEPPLVRVRSGYAVLMIERPSHTSSNPRIKLNPT